MGGELLGVVDGRGVDALVELDQGDDGVFPAEGLGGLHHQGAVLELRGPGETEPPETRVDRAEGRLVGTDGHLDVLRRGGKPGRDQLQVQGVVVAVSFDDVCHRIGHGVSVVTVAAHAPAQFAAATFLHDAAPEGFLLDAAVDVPLADIGECAPVLVRDGQVVDPDLAEVLLDEVPLGAGGHGDIPDFGHGGAAVGLEVQGDVDIPDRRAGPRRGAGQGGGQEKDQAFHR